MKMETKLGIAAGLGVIVGGLLVADHYEREKYKSTIKVDENGEVEDIHLSGFRRCRKSFIKKELPEEMSAAHKLWEQHEHLRTGFTMIIDR